MENNDFGSVIALTIATLKAAKMEKQKISTAIVGGLIFAHAILKSTQKTETPKEQTSDAFKGGNNCFNNNSPETAKQSNVYDTKTDLLRFYKETPKK